MIATFAVATALLGLTACSNENTAPTAEEVVAAEAANADVAVTEEAAVDTAVTDAVNAEKTGGPCGDGRKLAENEVCP